MRQVIVYPSDGWWVAEVPSLPGCVTQGSTREEALENAAEAAELWLEVAREAGDPIPSDAGQAQVTWLPRNVG